MKPSRIASLACASLITAAAQAANVNLPGSTLVVPGTSSTGISFSYSGTLTQADTIGFSQTGNPCLQPGNVYCVNGAGVLVVAGSSPVGGATSFAGPSGSIPAGSWTYGALLMQISGVGTVQIWPANAANGLGSGTPLRHHSTSGWPSAAAARIWSSKSPFGAMPGHCFQATATAPGTKPTHSRSASVRTSTSTARPARIQAWAVHGLTSPA